MGSTNFVKSLWLPDIQIFKCKQFKKRQIVTDVAGKIPFIMYLYSQASIYYINILELKFRLGEQGLSI